MTEPKKKRIKKKSNTVRARAFTGCWACRLKKRKCDEVKPVCSLCSKHNDPCSYDIRLMWLDNNLFKTNHKTGAFECFSLEKGTEKEKSISKKKFMELLEFGTDYTNDNDFESFTISARRFKTYNNMVSSVYYDDRTKKFNYDQKYVDWKLSLLLDELEESVKLTSSQYDIKKGPFLVFPCSAFIINGEDYLPLVPMIKHENTLTPMISKIERLPLSHDYHIIKDQQDRISNLVDEKVFGIIWLKRHSHSLLSRDDFMSWYLSYLKRTITASFALLIEQMIDNTDTNTPSYWIALILDNQFNFNIDCQSVGVTLTMLLYDNQDISQLLTPQLVFWYLQLNSLNFSIYPIIQFLIENSDSIELLIHCYTLLNYSVPNLEFFDQEKITIQLKVLVTNKLVGIWKSKLIQLTYLNQDTTSIINQLQFWETQHSYNLQFYDHLCIINDT
ncbi:hypothetical protein KAFR_0G03520 [Kazachstania africana CBS 2517]|uniref:Zn(2)-C6 fungal-type domain-containing protein n=1 Tax=Kazachstania africana (strain ATCC 22294 / BCRC 22015 / CBS 2517 / CECT 1963 / NBRC 1671 / NRRL Y-8276) TaxID=1071382 RepID=H2AYD4_KAZAF|nr:hypothetical protein KAFR_0G03520 [Kazachstania africana CBS 2517]CCF59384.1 hypothetical protein KAFR_0G03520 [Kazachstania africana CBS 2517]